MGRPKKSSRQNYEKYDSKVRTGTTREISISGEAISINWNEVVAVVVEAFCRGKSATEITEYVHERYGLELGREEPYSILSYAGTRGWMRFMPEHHLQFATNIHRMYPQLDRVDVAQTIVQSHVASRAAEMLVEIVQKCASRKAKNAKPAGRKEEVGARESEKRKRGVPEEDRGLEVHIGFSGGIMMRRFAEAFSDELCRAPRGMPKRIVFHAMVSGFDPYDPTTDPNSFFSYFMNRYAMQVEPRFIGFRPPPVTEEAQLKNIKKHPLYREAFDRAAELDVIVTSGSDCPEHSMLNQATVRSQIHQSTTRNGEPIGDFLWRPIGLKGPITDNQGIRAVTLMELEELPGFIDRGRNVLLLVSPCGGCALPKDQLLRIVLEQKQRYITHLVVDSLTAGHFLRNLPKYQVYGPSN